MIGIGIGIGTGSRPKPPVMGTEGDTVFNDDEQPVLNDSGQYVIVEGTD